MTVEHEKLIVVPISIPIPIAIPMKFMDTFGDEVKMHAAVTARPLRVLRGFPWL